jgi:hypothetical protein
MNHIVFKNLPGGVSVLLLTLFSIVLIQCSGGDSKVRDESKKPAGEQSTPAKEVVKEKPKLVYDDKGNIIERHGKAYKRKDGSLRSIDNFYYQYDDRGNVIIETKESFNPDSILMYKNVNYYTYNDKNLKIEQVFKSYDGNNLLQRTARNTFRYNENGHIVEDIGYYESGAIKSRIISDPDKNGAPRSEEYINYLENGTKTDHKKYYYSQFGLQKTVDLMEKK